MNKNLPSGRMMEKQININDLQALEATLQNGYDVNAPYDQGLSLFEVVCKTPGKKDFIRACLQYSASYNKQNARTKKYPIHLAAESLDWENLQELLAKEDLVIDAKYEDKTALFLLFAKLTLENRMQTVRCIKLILRRGANINATNEESVPPIKYLVDLCDKKGITEEAKLCVKNDLGFFLKNYSIDWNFRDGLVKRNINKHFPDIDIPTNVEVVTFEVLRNLLSAPEIDEGFFTDEYDKYLYSDPSEVTLFKENHKQLVEKAVEEGYLQITQHLMDKTRGKKNEPNELKDFHVKLLEKCCNRGHVELLKWLLLKTDVFKNVEKIEEPLLSVVVKQMSNCRNNNILGIRDRLLQCLDVLLEDSKVDVNQPDKPRSRTALYYAAKFGEDDVILKLLSKGAYLGVTNTKDQPLRWINSKLLKNHLDQCVSCNNEDEESDDFTVTIDFKNFIPPRSACATNDTGTMMQMAELPYINRLLTHPVFESLMMLKWQKFEPLLIANLAVGFILFCLITRLLHQRADEKCWELYWIIGVVILLKEAVQGFAYGWKTYFSSVENYVELLLILAYAFAPFFMFANIAAFLLSALQFMQLLSSLRYWSFSMHFVMLQKVFVNFLKCLVLFASIIVSFAFCFHVVFRQYQLSNDKASSLPIEAEEKFQQFDKLGSTFMKIMVMFTGEFDAGSINFDQVDYSILVFVSFVFCCHLVLLNVINGIAVSDSCDVKLDSKLIFVKANLSIIQKYETMHKLWLRLRKTSQKTTIQCISIQPNKTPMKIKPSMVVISPSPAANDSNVEEGDNLLTPKVTACIDSSDTAINRIVEKVMKILRKRANGYSDGKRIPSVEEIVKEVFQKLAEREGNGN